MGLVRALLGISIISLLAFGAPLARAECDKPIDLRMGGSASNLPSGDQGETFACGYFSAATLLDSYRNRAEGRLTSLPIDPIALAVDLAIERNRPRWLPFQITSDPLSIEDGRRGSILCDIVEHVRDNGVCDHRDARVFDREWMMKRSNQALALYQLFDRFADLEESDQADRLPNLVAAVMPLVADEDPAPHSREDLSRVLWENRDYPYRAIRALLYPSCATRRTTRTFDQLPSCGAEWFTSMGSIEVGFTRTRAERIADALNDGLEEPSALPIPAVQCFEVLHDGRTYEERGPLSSDCTLHYVTVLGRRKKKGICQFLVRNSYDHPGEDAISKDWERDGPDFWVDAGFFSRSAFALHWLE